MLAFEAHIRLRFDVALLRFEFSALCPNCHVLFTLSLAETLFAKDISTLSTEKNRHL